MKKLILTNLFLLVTLLILATPSTTSATVTDAASLFGGSEISKLNSKIQQVEHKHGITINLVTQKSIHGKDIQKVTRALVDKVSESPKSGANGNLVLLVVMDTRQFYMAADRPLQPRLFDSNGNPYFNEGGFVSGFKKGDYFSGFSSYVDTIDAALSTNHSNGAGYASNTSENAGGFNLIAAIVAVVGGIVIGVMYRSSLIASMSNVRPAITATEYLDKTSVNIFENRDHFLYMNVQRQAKSRGGSSGGGSGGSGGHGGSF